VTGAQCTPATLASHRATKNQIGGILADLAALRQVVPAGATGRLGKQMRRPIAVGISYGRDFHKG